MAWLLNRAEKEQYVIQLYKVNKGRGRSIKEDGFHLLEVFNILN